MRTNELLKNITRAGHRNGEHAPQRAIREGTVPHRTGTSPRKLVAELRRPRVVAIGAALADGVLLCQWRLRCDADELTQLLGPLRERSVLRRVAA